jgi:pyruvate/2-oxoglutarate dehydrogenase complex dihydrolipoamide dehydrogenase (E3) component
VFSHPPIGSVGLTEPQAVKKFGAAEVMVKESRFPSMLYAFNDPEAKVGCSTNFFAATFSQQQMQSTTTSKGKHGPQTRPGWAQ